VVKINVPDYGHLVLHFVHKKSLAKNPIPLLFCHGWPGSFLESKYILDPLSSPSAKSNNVAFDVVVPSIPGFGFSPAPSKPGVGPVITARAYKILMVDVLGYVDGFVTQGGDFGSFISRSIASQYPKLVIAQHLNMFPVPRPTLISAPLAYLRWCLSSVFYSAFEREAVRVRHNFETDQIGYLELQKTRPQTLGFALGDSPVGLLAWFVEKFHDWVDVDGNGNLSDTDVMDLIMMHWIQGATPGLRFYREAFWGGSRQAEESFETYVQVPTGVSAYAKEQYHVGPFLCRSCYVGEADGVIVSSRLGCTGCQYRHVERASRGWPLFQPGTP
jgi:pimeloyl-ACP methyl ester carboxylesterase